jgi:hypothetical protein
MTAARDNPGGILFGADSSSTLDVHALRTISIGIKAWPSGDTLVAADSLGISRVTLYKKMKKYGLKAEDFKNLS